MKKLLILPLIIVCIALLIGYFLSKTEKNKIHTLKPFEQLHFMRNYPDFESGSAAYLTAMKKEAGRIMNHPSQKNETSPVWKTQGPYNIGGRINTIAHNPGNDQTIYVGSVCGGIFKTIDGGENWFPIFDNQAYLSISHIVVSPHDTNTLYV